MVRTVAMRTLGQNLVLALAGSQSSAGFTVVLDVGARLRRFPFGGSGGIIFIIAITGFALGCNFAIAILVGHSAFLLLHVIAGLFQRSAVGCNYVCATVTVHVAGCHFHSRSLSGCGITRRLYSPLSRSLTAGCVAQ
jgi:hypothetical protein